MNNVFESYDEVNTLELLINDIEKALEAKMYLAALHMALSIPDMLGNLVYPKLQKKYIKWFDENVRDSMFGHLYSENPLGKSENSPKMNGEVCYALRCKLFHEGQSDIELKTKAKINEFVMAFSEEDYVFGNYAGTQPDFSKWDRKTNDIPMTSYLYISSKGLCKEIVAAAKLFYQNNPNLDYPKIRINDGLGRIDKSIFC